MKQVKTNPLALLLTTLIFATGLMAQTPKIVSFKGQLLDKDTHAPIRGAIVKYQQGSGDEFSRAVKSDERGQFTIPELGDTYLLRLLIRPEGYPLTAFEALPDGSKTPTVINIRSIEVEQEKLKRAHALETRQYTIQHGSAEAIFELIAPLIQREQSTLSRQLSALTVKATWDNMVKIDEIIAQYDVPKKQILMEVMLIKADGTKTPVPQNLKSVVKQLNTLFKYKGYRMVGQAQGLGAEGAGIRLRCQQNNAYSFDVKSGIKLVGQTIQLQHLSIQVPHLTDISSTINIKNGETVVLGATQGKNESDGALITVVKARIVE